MTNTLSAIAFRVHRWLTVLLFAITLHAALGDALASAAPRMLYVATNGNDAWSGTLAGPNAQKTDGPLATLEGARDAIRKLKRAGGLPQGGVTVEVRGGVYQRRETFQLTADDSGTEQAPVVYRGRPGEEVRTSGGRIVDNWRRVADPAVLQRLPESARGQVFQADLRALGVSDYGQLRGGGLELFFREEPMRIARGPNEDVIYIDDLLGGDQVKHRDGTIIDRVGKFTYRGDRPNRWVGEKEIWLHGYWYRDWAEDYQKVETLDPAKHYIALAPPYHRYGFRKGQWFFGLNLLAEIDLPGEWCLDRASGVLYFWPPAPIEKGRAVVSLLGSLVSMRNTSHVTLRGMIFEAARGTAVSISGGSHNKIAGCTLRNLGSWAVSIANSTASGVAGCDIYHTGDGGVTLSGGDRRTLTPAELYAHNNHIHHFSRWNRMCRPAVMLAGVGNRATNNLIHDAPHQAMSFSGNEHRIERNVIHHVCYEANDGGAIYAGFDWTMRGTVIRHNFMHDVTGLKARGCVGVYLDDMYSGTTISGNVFLRVYRAAFIGGGRDNVVENNVFVDCPKAMHMDARAMNWAHAAAAPDGPLRKRLEAMPYREPLWRKRYPGLLTTWEDEPAAPKGNVITRNVFVGKDWDDVFKEARPYVRLDGNLALDDPHFVDAAKMNFQLKDDSPVYQRLPGFQKIPFAEIGLVKDENRPALP